MEFINYDTCDKLIRKSVKGITIEKNPSNKEVLKHKSTRYLLHQHWVLVVLPIRKIVDSPPFWGGYLGFVIDDIQEARRGSRGFPLADNDKEGDAT